MHIHEVSAELFDKIVKLQKSKKLHQLSDKNQDWMAQLRKMRANLTKSVVKAHTRTNPKTGEIVQVASYTDKRNKQQEEAPKQKIAALPVKPQASKEEINQEVSYSSSPEIEDINTQDKIPALPKSLDIQSPANLANKINNINTEYNKAKRDSIDDLMKEDADAITLFGNSNLSDLADKRDKDIEEALSEYFDNKEVPKLMKEWTNSSVEAPAIVLKDAVSQALLGREYTPPTEYHANMFNADKGRYEQMKEEASITPDIVDKLKALTKERIKDMLDANGNITLYRGLSLTKEQAGGLTEDDTYDYSEDILSSWSGDSDMAYEFAAAAEGTDVGIVLEMEVSGDDILFHTDESGEDEFVPILKDYKARTNIYSVLSEDMYDD